jgi:hypothetical protein
VITTLRKGVDEAQASLIFFKWRVSKKQQRSQNLALILNVD